MSVCMNLILTKFDIIVIIAVLYTCMQFRLCLCACCNCWIKTDEIWYWKST